MLNPCKFTLFFPYRQNIFVISSFLQKKMLHNKEFGPTARQPEFSYFNYFFRKSIFLRFSPGRTAKCTQMLFALRSMISSSKDSSDSSAMSRSIVA